MQEMVVWIPKVGGKVTAFRTITEGNTTVGTLNGNTTAGTNGNTTGTLNGTQITSSGMPKAEFGWQ